MTCLRAQSLITPFINDELNIKDLEEFIGHVRSCKDCREELEVYYALLTAMQQLDEDRNLSDDFNMELAEKLDRSQDKIVHVKYVFYRKKGILVFIILLLAAYLSLQAYFIVEEENPTIVSSFRMRISFHEDRYLDI